MFLQIYIFAKIKA